MESLQKATRHLKLAWSYAFDHPEVIFGFGVGWALGMMLRIPWLTWELSDGASTVFGAAAGALIGAGGAALLAVRYATRVDRKVRADVASVLATLERAIENFLFENGQSCPRIRDAANRLYGLKNCADLTLQRLRTFQSSDRYVAAAGIPIVDGIVAIEQVATTLKGDADVTAFGLLGDPNGLYSLPQSSKDALADFLVSCQRISDALS